MQRNNTVFLCEHRTRSMQVDGELTPVMDLLVQTDRPENGGQHRVFVTGRQALELRHFIQASKGDALEVTVLGWLHSTADGAVVMAGRVTAVAPREVRRVATEAIRADRLLTNAGGM